MLPETLWNVFLEITTGQRCLNPPCGPLSLNGQSVDLLIRFDLHRLGNDVQFIKVIVGTLRLKHNAAGVLNSISAISIQSHGLAGRWPGQYRSYGSLCYIKYSMLFIKSFYYTINKGKGDLAHQSFISTRQRMSGCIIHGTSRSVSC